MPLSSTERNTEFHWGQFVSGLLSGAIIAVFGVVFAFNSRLVRVEARLEGAPPAGVPSASLDTASQLRSQQPGATDVVGGRAKIPAEKVLFHEPFDANALGWTLSNASDDRRYLEDGKYVIENSKPDWITLSTVALPPLPGNYDLHLTSEWITGDMDEVFGLVLLQPNASREIRHHFDVTRSGYTRVRRSVDGMWEQLVPTKGGYASSGARMYQRLEVRGGRVRYFVNGRFVGDLILHTDSLSVGMSVMSTQNVQFDDLLISRN